MHRFDAERILALYRKKNSSIAIAIELGCSVETVNQALKSERQKERQELIARVLELRSQHTPREISRIVKADIRKIKKILQEAS